MYEYLLKLKTDTAQEYNSWMNKDMFSYPGEGIGVGNAHITGLSAGLMAIRETNK